MVSICAASRRRFRRRRLAVAIHRPRQTALAARDTGFLWRKFMCRTPFMPLFGGHRGFIRIEFVRGALLVSRPAPLAGDIALLFFIHGGETPQAAPVTGTS